MVFKEILTEIKRIFKKIKPQEFNDMIREIRATSRIYIVGAGRSGLIAKYFAIRLVRLKKKVFVIGESVVPSIRAKDLLIAISGSGETTDVLSAVKISRVLGARVLGITAESESPLAKLSHALVLIPAKIPTRLGNQHQLRELIGVPERSPIKSLFEVCALIFLEAGAGKLSADNE